MVPSVLFVPGVPGVPELVVLVLIAVLVFGVPLVLVGALVVLYRSRHRETEERISELEREVESLRESEDE